jgi:hypothetical protein
LNAFDALRNQKKARRDWSEGPDAVNSRLQTQKVSFGYFLFYSAYQSKLLQLHKTKNPATAGLLLLS